MADDAHHGLVDLALEEAHRWLVHNQETFTDVVGERAPWWAPDRLNDAVTNRLHLEAVRWVADIRADPQHHARQALDSLLAQLARGPAARPGDPGAAGEPQAAGARAAADRSPPACRCGAPSAAPCSTALEDADGPLRERATRELAEFGARIGADEPLRRGWTPGVPTSWCGPWTATARS